MPKIVEHALGQVELLRCYEHAAGGGGGGHYAAAVGFGGGEDD